MGVPFGTKRFATSTALPSSPPGLPRRSRMRELSGPSFCSCIKAPATSPAENWLNPERATYPTLFSRFTIMANGTSGNTTSSRVSTKSFGKLHPSLINWIFTLVPGLPSNKSFASRVSRSATSLPSILTSRSPTRTPLSKAYPCCELTTRREGSRVPMVGILATAMPTPAYFPPTWTRISLDASAFSNSVNGSRELSIALKAVSVSLSISTGSTYPALMS
mmetsp:Transcript_23591/g.48086  ORF Transcript_23591/g.48086 Transcript_23591/m.48086 type:complete len:220 (-) Transcript_23591:242-901(-)